MKEQTDRQTDKQTDRQTNRQTDRQTDRQTSRAGIFKKSMGDRNRGGMGPQTGPRLFCPKMALAIARAI